MPVTVLVEPSLSGHRPQFVAIVAAVARSTSRVLVLTSRGAAADSRFQEHIGPLALDVAEVFDTGEPTTRQLVRCVLRACRLQEVDRVVLLDGDQALKSWWFLLPIEFGLLRRPSIHFVLTRYPTKVRLLDKNGWRVRFAKILLVIVARMTGSPHRVSCFAGRDDVSKGWIVKRARDPAICSAHSRDRTILRETLGLPANRRLVGIFGGISERKFPRLLWDALQAHQVEADLVLGGGLSPGVREWVATGPSSSYGQVIAYDRFFSSTELDQMVAASDIVVLAMTNNGPSGIMGKALAAEVPVVTAGSEVRAKEVRATHAGEIADLTADSLGAAVVRLLAGGPRSAQRNTVRPATAGEFAKTVLGVREQDQSPRPHLRAATK